MEQQRMTEHQHYLSFNEEGLIIIDKIQDLPMNSTYYTEHVLVIICTARKIQLGYDSQQITLQKDDLFFGAPGSVLSDYMVSPNFDCKLLAIKPSEVTSSREVLTQVLNSMIFIKTHPVIHLTESDSEDVFAYYNLICRCFRQTDHRYQNGEIRSLINAFLLRVVGLMAHEMVVPETEPSVRGEQLVEKFVLMVNEDCGRNRQVKYYANCLHITPKYLSSLVRATLDRTPTDVIRAMTMKEIERQLRHTSNSMKQISHAMNFPSTSFLCKFFKQNTGMTPSSYRKKYNK
ncbi:MAG: AraC family transcriptional regulator [Bacteroidaceae bacterium]|nr:AraC family transcriptional regulator [Bacteroidaceae bacterium]